jgi:hypothetical protein
MAIDAASMSFLSAPSAKMRTLSWSRVFIAMSFALIHRRPRPNERPGIELRCIASPGAQSQLGPALGQC